MMWVGRTENHSVEFQDSSKDETFCPDFYPDDFAGIPAQEGADWLKGSNKPPC